MSEPLDHTDELDDAARSRRARSSGSMNSLKFGIGKTALHEIGGDGSYFNAL
jgi:hypothetical protein